MLAFRSRLGNPGASVTRTGELKPGDILNYYDMCAAEQIGMLQRGMTFRLPPAHGIILMSQRPNAPYDDALDDDGNLIYEGHDAPRTARGVDPKRTDQPRTSSTGRPTENGKFADWTDRYKRDQGPPARFHVYEKLRDGIWTYRGNFLLRDYRYESSGLRRVFRFVLQSADETDSPVSTSADALAEAQTRQIPTWVKQFVYQRDKGRCVNCDATDQLHFDHDLPFSKGGSSATPQNVRLLCARCNLSKGSKIE